MRRITPSYHVREFLPDGRLLHIRAIRASDRDALHEAFHRLSKSTVRDRFFNVKLDLTPQELTYFTEVSSTMTWRNRSRKRRAKTPDDSAKTRTTSRM